MWIRSQNKKIIGQYSRIYIQENYKHEVQIFGEVINAGSFSNDDILGDYKTMEDAIKEMDNLQNEMFVKKSENYEMK